MLTATGNSGELDKIIDVLGDGAGNYFNKVEAMGPAVRAVGAGWYDNFRSEGARVGGWKPLKDYTIQERLARGYRAGPKLLQSGGLMKGAITPFINWSDTQSRHSANIAPTPGRAKTRGGGFSNDSTDIGASGPTRVVAALSSRRFFANVAGAKAMNQTGGRIPVASSSGWTTLPARPFWFFDQRMVEAAAKGIVDRFLYFQFRGMPSVTGINASSWARKFGTPATPTVNPGPAADPWFERR